MLLYGVGWVEVVEVGYVENTASELSSKTFILM